MFEEQGEGHGKRELMKEVLQLRARTRRLDSMMTMVKRKILSAMQCGAGQWGSG